LHSFLTRAASAEIGRNKVLNTMPVGCTQVACVATPSLPDLAKQIRAEHAAVVQAANRVLAHVLAAGRALITAQETVPKGQWEKWLRRNCEVSDRHARRYMALTRAYAEQSASGHTVSGDLVDLSLRGLMRQLTPASQNKQPAGRPRPTKPKKKPNRTTALDLLELWTQLPAAERRRFLDGTGLRAILEAIPEAWMPELEQWLEDHRHPQQSTQSPLVTDADHAIPDDLSVPKFLQRSAP
jgi:hypothetical protein